MEWRNLGEASLVRGLVDIIFGETFSLGAQADGRFFFISGASRVDGCSTSTNRQHDRSVFFPASSGPLTQIVRVKLSGDAPDVLFL